MIKLLVCLFGFGLPLHAFGQTCPGGEDEPAYKVKTDAGPVLMVCGFEDHEVQSPAGRRAFADFTISSWLFKTKAISDVFTGEPSSTYWLKGDGKGVEVTELWFFSDAPEAALVREVTCTADGCKVSNPRCVLKPKRAPFPKALAQVRKNAADLGDDGEELLDQVLAQALGGDVEATKFYQAAPKNLDARLVEVFDGNQHRLQVAKELKCLRAK